MVKKIFLIFIVIIATIGFTNVSKVKACDNIISSADNFVNEGKTNANDAIDSQKMKEASNLVYNTLLIVGTSGAVIVGAILGIQFITGSVEQKAKVKDSLIPFVVGCVVIFGAFGIWKLVITLLR